MSPRFSLNKTDIEKILKGACIAAGGALITYLLSVLPNWDFGTWTPVVYVVASAGLNAALKFIQTQSTPEVPQE